MENSGKYYEENGENGEIEDYAKPIFSTGWNDVKFVGTRPDDIIFNLDYKEYAPKYIPNPSLKKTLIKTLIKPASKSTSTQVDEDEEHDEDCTTCGDEDDEDVSVPVSSTLPKSATKQMAKFATSKKGKKPSTLVPPKIAPKPTAKPAQSTIKNDSKDINENEFWDYINRLNWRDRSDGVISLNELPFINSIGEERELAFWTIVDEKVEKLLNHFKKNKFFTTYSTLKKNEYRKLISHIVARGKAYYETMFHDPSIAGYLIPNEYQNLYMLDNV